MDDTKIIKTFIDLAKIPSPSGQEDKIRKFIISELKNKVDELFIDNAGNLYLKIKAQSKKSLLFSAHLDTVNPSGKQKIIIKDNFITGEGKYILGGDNKLTVAVIVELIKNLKRRKDLNLEIIFSTKEETDSSLRNFPKQKILAKEALVADLSMPIGNVMIAGSFVGGYSLEVYGQGGHARLLEKNITHPLSFLEEFIKKIPYGKINKNTIINIAIIKMGESYNSIPSKLYFTGEIRTFNKKDYEVFFQKIKLYSQKISKKLNLGINLNFYPYCHGYKLTEKNLILIKKVFKNLNIPYIPIKSYSVGDFNILNQWGIKTINIANGNIDAHTVNEKVPIDALLKIYKIFENYYFNY
ncbi:MAG: tripeptidase T [Candidatus Microgenomates bacterium]